MEKSKTTTKLNISDKLLAKGIMKVYETQRSFDTAVVITWKGRDSIYIGNDNMRIPSTATEATLQQRLERLKGAGLLFSYEKQGTSKVVKVLVREVRKQKERKDKFLRQTQLQLF
ncbi:MAG: hypothetical protein KF852_17755 [Saprospiraceae bacterium]|nr:hypothetical protein [Saprospiraceae bacterium]